MRALEVGRDILPIGEFKAHASKTVRGLKHRRSPLVITQNGRPAAVLLAPADFDRLMARDRFLAAVEEGLADVEAGRVVSDEELDRDLDRELQRARRR
ncbi:MAG: type II toxin-antitoxin system prevent-host-death family antitoxin [Myxococcales bacterium]|nr:type II toxin-antitoxin system prevent-host-death family antitoxin [Myxococcales bacterium]